MDRRQFLRGALAAGSLALRPEAVKPANESSARVSVYPKNAFGPIAANFIGLGYEISSVARNGLLSASNRQYVQLVRTLGTQGVVRVGGNTSDYSSFSRASEAVSAPKATLINERNLQELATFLDATGWDLIWGLNLGRGTEQDAVEEARAVADNVKGRLLAFEIGNEPDLFRRVHRGESYPYEDYLREYRRYKSAIRKQLPNVAFAGPDVAGATEWVRRFAADEGNDLTLLTHHYYRECVNPAANCDKLLGDDPKLAPELEKLSSAAASSHVPYRICETNSFCGGGKPGVSDTFCGALWALDFMFKLAWAGAAGLNMETGVNQLGFVSSYSPIGDDEHGSYSATPEYYGMLAFAQASKGQRIAAKCDAGSLNITAYAVKDDRGRMFVTVINKGASDAAVSIDGLEAGHGSLLRLTGTGLGSKEGVTLGDAEVSAHGTWKPMRRERLRTGRSDRRINVPATSAAIAIFQM